MHKQIIDSILIANEVLDRRIKHGEPECAMCKVDIENAFDQLNWTYLMIILKKIGFEDKWIKWIRCSILTKKYSEVVW